MAIFNTDTTFSSCWLCFQEAQTKFWQLSGKLKKLTNRLSHQLLTTCVKFTEIYFIFSFIKHVPYNWDNLTLNKQFVKTHKFFLFKPLFVEPHFWQKNKNCRMECTSKLFITINISVPHMKTVCFEVEAVLQLLPHKRHKPASKSRVLNSFVAKLVLFLRW